VLQVDLRLLDNDIINVAQIARFDTLVAINLPHHTAVASTDDAHLLGVGVEVHRDVRHHLVLRSWSRVQRNQDSWFCFVLFCLVYFS
jgi:hypothetical protein